MTKRTLALALGLVAATGGCYHYVPQPVVAPQGTPVRAYLDSLSSFELAQVTVNNINQVEGEVVRMDGTDLILSATWLQAITGNGYPGNGWTVVIPQRNVIEVERKRLSWWRTAVVVGGVAVATWFGFDALGLTGSSGDGGGGTVDPN